MALWQLRGVVVAITDKESEVQLLSQGPTAANFQYLNSGLSAYKAHISPTRPRCFPELSSVKASQSRFSMQSPEFSSFVLPSECHPRLLRNMGAKAMGDLERDGGSCGFNCGLRI